jgi:hypothetical protein
VGPSVSVGDLSMRDGGNEKPNRARVKQQVQRGYWARPPKLKDLITIVAPAGGVSSMPGERPRTWSRWDKRKSAVAAAQRPRAMLPGGSGFAPPF